MPLMFTSHDVTSLSFMSRCLYGGYLRRSAAHTRTIYNWLIALQVEEKYVFFDFGVDYPFNGSQMKKKKSYILVAKKKVWRLTLANIYFLRFHSTVKFSSRE